MFFISLLIIEYTISLLPPFVFLVFCFSSWSQLSNNTFRMNLRVRDFLGPCTIEVIFIFPSCMVIVCLPKCKFLRLNLLLQVFENWPMFFLTFSTNDLMCTPLMGIIYLFPFLKVFQNSLYSCFSECMFYV